MKVAPGPKLAFETGGHFCVVCSELISLFLYLCVVMKNCAIKSLLYVRLCPVVFVPESESSYAILRVFILTFC